MSHATKDAALQAPQHSGSAGRIMVFLCMIMLLNATGIGLMTPIIPDLLSDLRPMSWGQASIWGGTLSFVYAFMQFVMSPVLGNLSDRFGRRPILLTSLFLFSFDQLLMAMAPSLTWLFIARILSGGSAATHATANAVVADISKPDDRAKRFGLLGAAFGMGFVLGPLIGGLLGKIDPRAPFYASSALIFTAGIFGALVLPETLDKPRSRALNWRRANPIGTLLQIRKVPSVSWFLFAFFFFQMSHFTYPAIWTYFAREQYGWGPQWVGYSLFFFGLGYALVQGGLVRRVLPLLGESRTAILAFIINAIATLLLAIIGVGWLAMFVLPLSALGAMATPALNGMMSRLVANDAQGELQGATAAITAIAMMAVPIGMATLFNFATENKELFYFPGFPLLIAGVLMLFALLPLSLGIRAMRAKQGPQNKP